MIISLIAAMDRRGLIGTDTGLPWHLPGDLKRFRAYTWGKPIVMGRRTHEMIGKPLPGRFNIVLTRHADFHPAGCSVAATLEEALSLAETYLAQTGGDEVAIIGGGQIYGEAIPYADRMYLTVVEGQFSGTAYFPLRELLRQHWRPARAPELCPPDEKNPYRHSFQILERVRDGHSAITDNEASVSLLTMVEPPSSDMITSDELATELGAEAANELTKALARIEHCVGQLSDEQLWWRSTPAMNSIGNLILHLCGNLRQWIVAGLSGAADGRNRPAEFSERGPIPKDQLLGNLEAVVAEANQVLSKMTAQELMRVRRIQGFDVTGVAAIFDSVPHFRGHTQEIVNTARLQLGERYTFAWKPATREQGAP